MLNEDRTDWQVVLFGATLGALAAFQQFKLPPAMPILLKQFGYSKTLAGGFMSVYALAGLFLSLPVGRAMGRRGAWGVLVVAFAAFLAGNLLGLALPEHGWVMMASRVLESAGFAILAVVGAVLTTSYASEKDRPIAVALWATWIPAGQIISTFVAIPTVSAGLWRPLWVATALMALGAFAWGAYLKSTGRPAFAPPVSAPGATKTGGPIPADRRKLLLAASALFGVWSGQYITYVTWLPQYLVESHGLAAGTAARAYLIPSVMVVVANLYAARLLRRRSSLAAMLGLSTALQAACWFLIPLTTSTAMGVASLVVYGLTSGVTATAIFTLPATLLGREAPRGFAAMMAGRNLGVLIGPVLLAQTVTLAGNWAPIPWIFGAACVACAGLGLYLDRSVRTVEA